MSKGFSFQTGEIRSLSALDYILFSLLFAASALIGFYHAYRWRNKTNEFEFHFAGKSLHPLPVSMSLSATFFSAITILGVPADVYTYNSMFIWSVAASFISTIFVAHVFVPFFYNLHVNSCFKYIELRFGKPLRLCASMLFIVQYLLYASIALYLPCLALEAIINVSLWYTMIIVCAVCSLYTILGGMRSVVWVDTLQFVVIIVGLLAALIGGSNATGGIQDVWRKAVDDKRAIFDDFSMDPRTRHSVWSVSIGFAMLLIFNYGVAQVQVQRVCTLSTSRQATIASWLGFPMFALMQCLVCMTGLVMYAFYSTCDPVKYGVVSKNDQLVPLFVLDVLGSTSGMPGLFMACVFSGSLSSISSCLNTLSTVLLEDFVKPFCCRRFADRNGLFVSRLLIFILVCFQFLGAVVVSRMSRLVLQFTNSVYAVISGPLFGLFVSGMFLPWSNKKGAATGLFLSLAFMLWLCIGSLIERPVWTIPLQTRISGCNWNVTSRNTNSIIITPNVTNMKVPSEAEPMVYNFYRMSYLWYTGLGMLVNVIITLVISILTGYTKPNTLDSRLICPIFDNLFPWLPEKVRRPLRCGMNFERERKPREVTEQNDNGEIEGQTTRLMEIKNTD